MSTGGSVVYVIGGEGLSSVKIGWSLNPMARMEALQTAAPVRLRLLWTVPGGRALERQLHDRFHACRTHGEWFDLTSLGDPVDVVRAAVGELAPDLTAGLSLYGDGQVLSIEHDEQGREIVVTTFQRLANEDDWPWTAAGTPMYGVALKCYDEDGEPRTSWIEDVVREGVTPHHPLVWAARLRASYDEEHGREAPASRRRRRRTTA